MSDNLATVVDNLLRWAKAASSFLIDLEPLTLSADKGVVGTPITLRIRGATAGGTVTCVPPDGLTFDSATLTITGTPTTAGQYQISLRETHPLGKVSPKTSVVGFLIVDVPVVPAGPLKWGQQGIRWGQGGMRWGGSAPVVAGPRLSLIVPLVANEGDPSAVPPALTLTVPPSFAEGDPVPTLTLMVPMTIGEGDPA